MNTCGPDSPPDPALGDLAARVRANAGLTLEQAARWLGIDRGTLARAAVVIPCGVAPRVKRGEVPVRQVGGRKIVFPGDVPGWAHAPTGASSGARDQEKPDGKNHQELAHKIRSSTVPSRAPSSRKEAAEILEVFRG